MKVYFSYSTKVSPHRTRIDFTLKMAKLNCPKIKDLYNEIYLITDDLGKDLFKDIGFTKIFTSLEVLPDKYKPVWSLGKLYAMREIAEKNEQFMHLDFDFFITKRLPSTFENEPRFVQSMEKDINGSYFYNTDIYNHFCKNKYLAEGNLSKVAYNCGIIGGSDCEFFYSYADSAIKMVQDPANEPLWLGEHKTFRNFTKATLAEQYYLGCALLHYNKKIRTLFLKDYITTTPYAKRAFKKLGAIHFYGLRDRTKDYASTIEKIITLNKS